MLFQKATDDLARSGIVPEQAAAAGMVPVEDASQIDDSFEPVPALVLPYLDPVTGEAMTFRRDDQKRPFCRVRYLEQVKQRVSFKKAKAQRYGQPPQSGVYPYFPLNVGVDWTAVLGGDTPILVTEGEKKALAGCLVGLPTIGLGGVFNFMSDGEMLPALDRINWKGRSVYIVFDSDAADNPNIQAAEGRLASELSMKRGAMVHVVRIPQDGDGKMGIDDFLVAHGRDAFFTLLENTRQIRKTDAAVLSLNKDVCWIEAEGKVFDLSNRHFIGKDDFKNGSKFSAIKVIQPNLKGGGTKEVSIPAIWLTHPHAQRYQDVTFDPTTTEKTVPAPSGTGTCLNLWEGWNPLPGDVDPFLQLNAHIFGELPSQLQDFCLKLVIYKFQNPGVKVPLAPVLLGSQGSGKTLWASIIRDAAGSHGVDIPSRALVGDYNGWVESSLIAVINEAEPRHVAKGAEALRNMISEETAYLNEKFRVGRQVRTYTFYILTANKRDAGHFDSDDRRMFVVGCKTKHEDGKAFYGPIVSWWKYGNGARKLLNWMLEYDLQGWTPPVHAPMTTEKYAARIENASPVERLAEDMQTADHNTVAIWIHSAMIAARSGTASTDSRYVTRCQEVVAALGAIQIRPFYTTEELAAIFPMIAEQFYSDKATRNNAAGTISKSLRENGIRTLINKDDPRGFRDKHGRLVQYLIIATPDDVPREMTQAQLEHKLQHFPSYQQWAAKFGQ